MPFDYGVSLRQKSATTKWRRDEKKNASCQNKREIRDEFITSLYIATRNPGPKDFLRFVYRRVKSF